VLIIDDDEMIGITLTRLLTPAHDVTALRDARKALARIARGERFDVILCDLMMPSMTGAEFYQALGPIAAEQLDKIIFMSGGTFTASAHAFLDRTANTWLQKPFDTRALVALVNAKLG
jgi:DNA-binding response OmpR family regulator